MSFFFLGKSLMIHKVHILMTKIKHTIQNL